MRRTVVAVAAIAALHGAGCAGSHGPASPPPASEPRWEDLLEPMPAVILVVRPRTLRKDPVYGPFLERAIDTAEAQNPIVAATRPLQTLEDADEVVAFLQLGDLPLGEGKPSGDLVLVERGVRADIDPGKLVDDDGQPLWSAGPSAATRELVRASPSGRARRADGQDRDPTDASLFELPGRTWVIATGAARARARAAFEHPTRRPALDLEPSALAVLRLDGPSLLSHVHALQTEGALGAIGRGLRAATLTLAPGGDGTVKVTLNYSDADDAARSEISIFQALGAIRRSNLPHLAWLTSARVDMPEAQGSSPSVVVQAPLPRHVLDALGPGAPATAPAAAASAQKAAPP